MCGIVGYIGTANAKELLLRGLEKLEYRGYDSAGIAVRNEEEIKVFKEKEELLNYVKQLLMTLMEILVLDILVGQLTVCQTMRTLTLTNQHQVVSH